MVAFLSYTLLFAPIVVARSIKWFECPPSADINNATDGGVPLTCGSLEVPLDYTRPNSSRLLTLQLTKVNATTLPFKGSILVNPGGPGGDGADIFAEAPAGALLALSGGQYDIIAFNPRGTGQTLPFSCFKSEKDRDVAALLTPYSLGESNTALGQVWATNGALAQLCYENSNHGDLIGTAFTARDMFQIVDALDEDGLLRYYGSSYGTVLGATAAALFPERIERMILDGSVSLKDYFAGNSNHTFLQEDETIRGFFEGCIESPELCPLTANGSSAKTLENQTYRLLQSLIQNPLSAPSGLPNTLLVDYSAFQRFLHGMLYFPARWPYAAQALDYLFRGNIPGYLTYASIAGTIIGFSVANPDTANPEAYSGIQCGDSTVRSTNLTQFMPIIHYMKQQSRFLGTANPTTPTLLCAQWKLQAKEIPGPFHNIRTKHPILFVGNSVDPETPIINARESSKAFPGSVVLENNGYGHTSVACPSLCTANYILQYFLNGTLPANNTICRHDYKVFETPPSYLDVIGGSSL